MSSQLSPIPSPVLNREIGNLNRAISGIDARIAQVQRDRTVNQGGTVIDNTPPDDAIQSPGEELYERLWHQEEADIALYPLNAWIEFPLYVAPVQSSWMVLMAWANMVQPFTFPADLAVAKLNAPAPFALMGGGPEYTYLYRGFALTPDEEGRLEGFPPTPTQDKFTHLRRVGRRFDEELEFLLGFSVFLRRTGARVGSPQPENVFHVLVNYRTPANYN